MGAGSELMLSLGALDRCLTTIDKTLYHKWSPGRVVLEVRSATYYCPRLAHKRKSRGWFSGGCRRQRLIARQSTIAEQVRRSVLTRASKKDGSGHSHNFEAIYLLRMASGECWSVHQTERFDVTIRRMFTSLSLRGAEASLPFRQPWP